VWLSRREDKQRSKETVASRMHKEESNREEKGNWKGIRNKKEVDRVEMIISDDHVLTGR
jgi:hypothetical protein